MKNKLLTLWLVINFWLLYPLTKSLQLFFVCLNAFYKKRGSKKILFLENLPIENAGYQYRSFKWKKHLEQLGWQVSIKTIIENKTKFDEATAQENIAPFIVLAGWRRLWQVVSAINYDAVIVRRELLLYNDYGNLFMEKLLLSVNKNVVLDFDDNIAEAKREPRDITNWVGKLLLENGNKFSTTLIFYPHFIVGTSSLKKSIAVANPTLKEEKILFIPTCVDYDSYSAKKYFPAETIVIGWVGSIVNLPYLDLVMPALNELSKKTAIELIISSGINYEPKIPISFPIKNEMWKLETEIEQLLQFDLGIMPLLNSEIAKGKSGFKLLQYMGLGIIPIASAVGINAEIIEDGGNGFLVKNENDWLEVFEKAILQKNNFEAMGLKARQKVVAEYSFSANQTKYDLFLKKITSL